MPRNVALLALGPAAQMTSPEMSYHSLIAAHESFSLSETAAIIV
jgi:hypothetical protein